MMAIIPNVKSAAALAKLKTSRKGGFLLPLKGVDMAERIVCMQCGREKSDKEYFMTKKHEKYPLCKSCLTQYIDNNDPNTFL